MPTPPAAVSAPGKVLLAGGYLVLDRAYTGLVFGLSARVNVVAEKIRTSAGIQLSEIVVTSPQFLEAQWRYGFHLAPEGGGIKVTQLHVGSQVNHNPFVETTLSYALTYISCMAGHRPTYNITPARLTILADNDYYSQPHSKPHTEKNPSRFSAFPTTLKDAHKTGLGSSAALVTSLTAALLTFYLSDSLFDLDTGKGKRTLHNLAQAAHCAAQGKVGSGFDVAAAVYGSCRYRRFSPSILKDIPEVGTPGFATALIRVVEETEWDTETSKNGVSVPPGVALRMCDVDCGSQTVGMVKKVLAWRDSNPDSKTLWDDLQSRNETLGIALKDGRTESIVESVGSVRKLVREMGEKSDVPIEPESQTRLLDALGDIEGVYNGVVPGAGGFDALALLMRDDEETVLNVKKFLNQWTEENGSMVRLLDVEGEMEGIRKEGLEMYAGWIQ